MINIIKDTPKNFIDSNERFIEYICEAARAQGFKFVLNRMMLEGVIIDCSVFRLGVNNCIVNCKFLNGPIKNADVCGGNWLENNA